MKIHRIFFLVIAIMAGHECCLAAESQTGNCYKGYYCKYFSERKTIESEHINLHYDSLTMPEGEAASILKRIEESYVFIINYLEIASAPPKKIEYFLFPDIRICKKEAGDCRFAVIEHLVIVDYYSENRLDRGTYLHELGHILMYNDPDYGSKNSMGKMEFMAGVVADAFLNLATPAEYASFNKASREVNRLCGIERGDTREQDIDAMLYYVIAFRGARALKEFFRASSENNTEIADKYWKEFEDFKSRIPITEQAVCRMMSYGAEPRKEALEAKRIRSAYRFVKQLDEEMNAILNSSPATLEPPLPWRRQPNGNHLAPDLGRVARIFREIYFKNTSNYDVSAMLGFLYMMLGRYDEALTFLAMALNSGSCYVYEFSGYDYLKGEIGGDKYRLLQGWALLMKGNPEEAKIVFGKIKNKPSAGRLLALLAEDGIRAVSNQKESGILIIPLLATGFSRFFTPYEISRIIALYEKGYPLDERIHYMKTYSARNPKEKLRILQDIVNTDGNNGWTKDYAAAWLASVQLYSMDFGDPASAKRLYHYTTAINAANISMEMKKGVEIIKAVVPYNLLP